MSEKHIIQNRRVLTIRPADSFPDEKESVKSKDPNENAKVVETKISNGASVEAKVTTSEIAPMISRKTKKKKVNSFVPKLKGKLVRSPQKVDVSAQGPRPSTPEKVETPKSRTLSPLEYVQQLLALIKSDTWPASLQDSEGWEQFYALTDIDMSIFDADERLCVVTCIQGAFSDPKSLLHKLSNESDEFKLQLDSLLKKVDLNRRISILGKNLENNRSKESAVSVKLEGIESRNNVWLGSLKKSLGVADDDWSDEDWIDDE